MRDEPAAFPGADPVRLDSSRFKGLMPCYEVVVALASQDKGAAGAVSAALDQRGFDNYLKNAGKWVGARPALEASCERMREGANNGCPSGARFVEVWNGTAYLEVGADAEIVESAFANAPEERPVGKDGLIWEATLPLRTVGDLTLGESVYVSTPGKAAPVQCSLERFVSLTRGVPHFGWASRWPEEVSYEPGCGSSELFVRLDCSVPVPEDSAWSPLGTGLAWDAPGQMAVPVNEPVPATGDPLRALESSEAWRLARAEAQREATDRGVALLAEITSQTWRLGATEYQLVGGRLYSGEGVVDCGGDDVNVRVQGLMSGDGAKPSVSFRDTSFEEWRGFFEGDSGLVVVAQSFPLVTQLFGSEGEEVCRVDVPFCDCGC
jgi:hypothetical protein